MTICRAISRDQNPLSYQVLKKGEFSINRNICVNILLMSITINIIGDSGPFSKMGKSIGYQIIIGDSNFLLDCGAPLFKQLGGNLLKYIDGLILTHCHDDHKRWFTDFALYKMYARDAYLKVFLLTSEEVYRELEMASEPALNRSLSSDSKRIIDISYDRYIDFRPLGPRPKYTIERIDEGFGKTSLCIIDREGHKIGPDKAKIIINKSTWRPRMLFRDPLYNEWVEPESFYPFSSPIFYEEKSNTFHDQAHFSIEAIKAPVWHGITGIGIRIKTEKETLVFSSDTVNNIDLWTELYQEKLSQKMNISEKEFESSSVIYGDINDYIERIWSKERYSEAVKAFDNAVVIHDISSCNSVVHTNYEDLERSVLKKEMALLTHSPDQLTSEWVLSNADKTILIEEDRFYEIVDDKIFPFNADIYHKENGRYYVGFKNQKGRYKVYKNKSGLLGISRDNNPALGHHLYNIDVYEDIAGRYFPKLEERDSIYFKRKDGKVEVIRRAKDGSKGMTIDDQRGRLLQDPN